MLDKAMVVQPGILVLQEAKTLTKEVQAAGALRRVVVGVVGVDGLVVGVVAPPAQVPSSQMP